MHARSRRDDRRAGRGLALLLACAVVGTFGCTGAAMAAPGLTPLGGKQIGLPAGDQSVGAMVMHRGEVHAAVIEENGDRAVLEVVRINPASGAWQPVAGPLTIADGEIRHVSLLSRGDELYAAWVEPGRAGTYRAVVARLTPDRGSWARIVQAPGRRNGTARLAQVGNQVWAAWDDDLHVRLARVTAGYVDVLSPHTLPANASLNGLVGYGDDAYVAYTQTVNVDAHRAQHGDVPAQRFFRLRIARLALVPDRARVQVTALGSWDDRGAADVFLAAGAADAPARPILAWNTEQRIVVMRMREGGNGFERIPIAPLVTLRHLRGLRGIAATPAAATIAAAVGGPDDGVHVYTLTESHGALTISDGDPLPRASRFDDVTMIPTPRPTDPGAVMLGYNRESPSALRATAMRYSP